VIDFEKTPEENREMAFKALGVFEYVSTHSYVPTFQKAIDDRLKQ
jgi:hypothetical protein